MTPFAFRDPVRALADSTGCDPFEPAGMLGVREKRDRLVSVRMHNLHDFCAVIL